MVFLLFNNKHLKQTLMYLKFRVAVFIFLCLMFSIKHFSQTTQVGSGSYTNTFPGVDAANRNGQPSGTPQLSGNADGKPVPTNDWWSKLIKEDHAGNLFNYPMTMKTTNNGLIVTYIPWGVIGDSSPIEVSLTGLSVTKATVSDFSDWTVTMNWKDSDNELKATSGIGMPFLYFEKDANDEVSIKIKSGNVSISNELLIIENASNNADFVFYAPVGSTWSKSGTTYSSTLNNKTYWSMAMLPQSTTNVNSVAQEYKKYAYVFPTNTTATWSYDNTTSKLTTTFNVSTSVKEGSNTNMLLGLLPHQWSNLSSTSARPNEYSYSSVRGEIKTLKGNSFIVENKFKGILPTLPNLVNYSPGFNPIKLSDKISQIEDERLASWTDSYNDGQLMNRLIQTARIADQIGNTKARDKIVATIKERLEDWLSYEAGEVAFLFYYNSDWATLIGYPAGHGQDSNLNDHHFHWGYFIHAASFIEQLEPGWASKWGGMVNLLIRDAASQDRNDTKFPFLRNFSPYAGHSWANGFATFPQGNDQESSSESIQFASSLIHWGSITNDDDIRDLGIYIYTTEQSAIEEYWFDVHDRIFKPTQQYSLVSRIWGNSYDNGTFWTSDIAASYGIELYPIHGGSLYLGHNTGYAQKLWTEITQNTGILSNEKNDNLWHDTYWKFQSFIDPQEAIKLYDSYPDRNLKFGISDAQTYYWLHSMNALGKIDASITANHPIAAAFNKNGDITYVGQNYSDSQITITFSDGATLDVPAKKMATNKDISVSGTISSDFNQAYANGSVNLSVTTTGSGVTKVEFFDGSTLLGTKNTAPYNFKAQDLSLGIHGLYAKIYAGTTFNITNIVKIQVGEQVPFLGRAFQIPGIIEAGNYDKFEGGVGQGISYIDTSINNLGDYRKDEYVDASSEAVEGKVIGWPAAGEWLEYTIDVQTSGKYDVNVRFASDNNAGGGPFYFEIDGDKISPDISLTNTNGWNEWQTKTINNVELSKGKHILRLVITNGEFNLAKMTFSRSADLGYTKPVSNAGNNVVVVLPSSATTLDGTLSNHPEGSPITYLWEQIYGPSIISFDDETAVSPNLSNLEKGIYKCKLTVSDGTYTSKSYVLVIVQETANSNPFIHINSPKDNSTFIQNTPITISATASDLDGAISKVSFYEGNNKLGEATSEPYNFVWNNASVGSHQLKAIATDNGGATSTSNIVNIQIDEVRSCSEKSNEAQQGSFSTGYIATFETIGSSVKISFELLDTNRAGVVAYLWKRSPFGETQMENAGGLKFSKTIGGVTAGETITYGCKFAFAGGLAVTKYISYRVGDSCSPLAVIDNFLENKIKIYPNPVKQKLYIESPSASINKVEINSVQGKKIELLNPNEKSINVEELSSGLYFLKIYTSKGIVVLKMLKQ